MFAVNGKLHVIDNPDPTLLLVDYLRSRETALTGTKLVCGEGGCGACTVTLTTWDPGTDSLTSRPINSCLRPVCLLDGQAVTTVEGIGNVRDGLHPVQYEVGACNASQCGFCTPGFVMNMFAGLQKDQKLTAREIEDRFDGHICRCTGFRPILQAMRTFAVDAAKHEDFRSNHPCQPAAGQAPKVAKTPAVVVFPEELKARVRAQLDLRFEGRGYQWHRPTDISGVQAILREHGGDRAQVKLVGGNTDVGIYKVDVNDPHVLVDISAVRGLRGISADANGVHVGAATTLQELLEWIDANTTNPASTTGSTAVDRYRGLSDLRRHLDIVANLQVRSAGTIGGNIMMARLRADTPAPFPSDLLLTFSALNGVCVVASATYPGGWSSFAVSELPAPSALPDDAVLVDFHLPWTGPNQLVRSYKVRMRNEDSHPIVNTAFRVQLTPGTPIVEDAWLYFGGLAGLPLRASATEAALKGQRWDERTLAAVLPVLEREVAAHIVDYDGTEFLPRGYRASLCRTLFYKFYVYVAEERGVPVSPAVASAGRLEERPLTRGTEITDVYPQESPVGMPILKDTAFLQTTGEAIYTADLPLPPHGLVAAYVLSGIARGRFQWRGGSSAALAAVAARVSGVVDLVTIDDVPILRAEQLPAGTDPLQRPNNLIGMGGDDPVFAQDGKILSWGQPIALVLAKDSWAAQTAARILEEEYLSYEAETPILEIEQALAEPHQAGVFQDLPTLDHIPSITRSGSDVAWLDRPDKPLPGGALLQGMQRTEAQAQFYLEVQNCMVVPGEGDDMEIYSSTQQPASIQQYAASILGVPAANIQVYVRRLGGGFGGKQFRPYMLSTATAVAARKARRPVKLVLTRNQDMATIGKRHPYRSAFAVSYTPEGQLQGMRLDMVSNGGCTYDASFPVMDLSQQNGDGCYFVPTYRTTGTVARTNLASNTAMRGFGTLQAILAVEEAIERVAHSTGLLPEDVRRRNMYQNATLNSWQQTHFAQDLKYCNAIALYDHLRTHCEFDRRQAEITAFNEKNRWKKRGICLMPFKYGVGYQPRTLEQGSAYVSIYAADGTVLVQHGGIELGQGINTKMTQIAAQELGIPMSLIRIGDTWTGAAPNSEPTAASSGSDLFGSAVKLACQTLRARLLQYCEYSNTPAWTAENPSQWRKVVANAFGARVDLQAEATYKAPYVGNIGGDQPYGRVFLYFTYSAACSEVEIDVLTGETTLLRTDILFDNGQSLNPCLDIGQIEGGFLQGAGLMLTEQMMYTPDGALYSDGTWDYKPPGTKSVPLVFNVRLHQMQRYHPVTGLPLDYASVNGSKGIGEPPLVLAATVFFAVKHAVVAARRDRGDTGWPEITAPATVGRVQAAIGITDDTLQL
ncbi:molybdopterin cofactor-binding domain-containing protein [Hyalangium versicolor]|uniref:molybdopterin cofactor-binding domain-containing protein n=1 Tax=Hyalangium versicolor TaxID=2861190 RepID=UPI001CCAD3B7|nr:molybdopterin cofactor-binding domain-containing protein [Hyalangium versicolor]